MLKRLSRSIVVLGLLSLGANACVSDDQVPAEEVVNLDATLETGMSDLEPAEAPEASDDTSAISLESAAVYFDYDDFTVGGDSSSDLEAIAEQLKADNSLIVTLEGHCDSRGSTEYNLALGERRAQAVKSYLLTMGVAETQLLTVSYGEERLQSMGDSEADHSKNRRVQFSQ